MCTHFQSWHLFLVQHSRNQNQNPSIPELGRTAETDTWRETPTLGDEVPLTVQQKGGGTQFPDS